MSWLAGTKDAWTVKPYGTPAPADTLESRQRQAQHRDYGQTLIRHNEEAQDAASWKLTAQAAFAEGRMSKGIAAQNRAREAAQLASSLKPRLETTRAKADRAIREHAAAKERRRIVDAMPAAMKRTCDILRANRAARNATRSAVNAHPYRAMRSETRG